MTNLEYLLEATRGLSLKETDSIDNFLIGVLSVEVSERAWKDAVNHAVRMAHELCGDQGRHSIDTERLRCSCGAPMCHECGGCVAECACLPRDPVRASNANSKLLIGALKGHL